MPKLFKLALYVSTLVTLMIFCTGFASAEGTKNGVVNSDAVNVRTQPNTSSTVVTKAGKGTSVVILKEADGWYNVTIGNSKGWISSKYVTVSKDPSTGTISGQGVNLRSGAALSAKVVTKLNEGNKVSILEKSGDWYKIKTASNVTGWVNKDFLSVNAAAAVKPVEAVKPVAVSRGEEEVQKVPEEAAKEPEAAQDQDGGSEKIEKILETAKKLVGVKYVYGGSSPSGFDCSGFTTYVFKQSGIGLERVAADQSKQGKHVDKGDLKPGDLVFFDTNGGRNFVNHVGIYIGDGSFIHASSGRNSHRVVVTELSESFYVNAYMTARRIVE